jgi:hypothetical protein
MRHVYGAITWDSGPDIKEMQPPGATHFLKHNTEQHPMHLLLFIYSLRQPVSIKHYIQCIHYLFIS